MITPNQWINAHIFSMLIGLNRFVTISLVSFFGTLFLEVEPMTEKARSLSLRRFMNKECSYSMQKNEDNLIKGLYLP